MQGAAVSLGALALLSPMTGPLDEPSSLAEVQAIMDHSLEAAKASGLTIDASTPGVPRYRMCTRIDYPRERGDMYMGATCATLAGTWSSGYTYAKSDGIHRWTRKKAGKPHARYVRERGGFTFDELPGRTLLEAMWGTPRVTKTTSGNSVTYQLRWGKGPSRVDARVVSTDGLLTQADWDMGWSADMVAHIAYEYGTVTPTTLRSDQWLSAERWAKPLARSAMLRSADWTAGELTKKIRRTLRERPGSDPNSLLTRTFRGMSAGGRVSTSYGRVEVTQRTGKGQLRTTYTWKAKRRQVVYTVRWV